VLMWFRLRRHLSRQSPLIAIHPAIPTCFPVEEKDSVTAQAGSR
jgi:hypothetical protein